MEELIQNFMINGRAINSIREVYFEAENPKVHSVYIVSKGGGVPYRMKIEHSFCNLSILEKLAWSFPISRCPRKS